MNDLFNDGTPDPDPRKMHCHSLSFDGPDYVHSRDSVRLTGQCFDVFNLMKDGTFRSLEEISTATGHPPASISAQLRHLRKARFGSHTIEKEYLGNGLFRYKLIVHSTPLIKADP